MLKVSRKVGCVKTTSYVDLQYDSIGWYAAAAAAAAVMAMVMVMMMVVIMMAVIIILSLPCCTGCLVTCERTDTRTS